MLLGFLGAFVFLWLMLGRSQSPVSAPEIDQRPLLLSTFFKMDFSYFTEQDCVVPSGKSFGQRTLDASEAVFEEGCPGIA